MSQREVAPRQNSGEPSDTYHYYKPLLVSVPERVTLHLFSNLVGGRPALGVEARQC